MANVIVGLLLSVGSQTIYDLNKQFESSVSLFYRASLGALRAALTGLLERGEIVVEAVVEGGRAKKRYSVTETGRAAFDTWMRIPITGSDLETAALSRTFFLGLVTDVDERLAILDGILLRAEADTAALSAIAEQLDHRPIPIELAETARFRRATLEYGIGAHEHALAFFRRLRDETAAPRR